MSILRGRVTSGQGDLAHRMTVYANVYEAKAGFRLYPGSLNVALDHDYRLPAERVRIEPDELDGIRGISLIPCYFYEHRVFIFRTDRNEAELGDHPRSLIEIVSSVRLKDAYALHDGDQVEVDVPD